MTDLPQTTFIPLGADDDRRHAATTAPRRDGVPMITLVLLPGMDGTGELFGPFIAALDGEFNVKVVSYPTTAPLDYSELESFARAELPAEGPFVLLGESFSGPIAVCLAASAPHRLKGLILCCTFVRNPRPIFAGMRSLVGILPVALAPVRLLSHLLLGSFSTAPLRTALVKSLAQVSAPALRARLRSVLQVDVSAKLSAVTVPTLYLRASSDRLVPPSASALISQLAPRSRVVQLEGPHFLLQAAPALGAEAVRSFLHEVHD